MENENIEQEYDGFDAIDGYSEPLADLDYVDGEQPYVE